MNNTLGMNLFTSSTWHEEPPQMARRLHLNLEKTIVQEKTLYSAYTNISCLDSKLYQIKIQSSKPDEIDFIILILINKGDYSNSKDFHSQFKKSSANALKKIESSYGKVRKNQDAIIWNLDDAIVTLTVSKDEYLAVTLSNPNSKSKLKDHEQRRLNRIEIKNTDYTANVEQNDFGDTFIKNIPMVNQGSKGYCAPATIERCLLYFGIMSYDMHKLAEEFQTQNGGGTSMNKLIPQTRNLLEQNGVNVKLQYLSLSAVAKTIDKGGLVVWCFSYDDKCYERINNNSLQRSSNSPQNWNHILSKQKRLKKGENTHMNIIHGYNKSTQELAISDSWGERHHLHWLPIDDAKNLVNGKVIVLLP